MRPKKINISEENVSLVTEVIEQEYGNPFGMHFNKEKLANISSGAALNDDIAESILNMGEGGNSKRTVIVEEGSGSLKSERILHIK